MRARAGGRAPRSRTTCTARAVAPPHATVVQPASSSSSSSSTRSSAAAAAGLAGPPPAGARSRPAGTRCCLELGAPATTPWRAPQWPAPPVGGAVARAARTAAAAAAARAAAGGFASTAASAYAVTSLPRVQRISPQDGASAGAMYMQRTHARSVPRTRRGSKRHVKYREVLLSETWPSIAGRAREPGRGLPEARAAPRAARRARRARGRQARQQLRGRRAAQRRGGRDDARARRCGARAPEPVSFAHGPRGHAVSKRCSGHRRCSQLRVQQLRVCLADTELLWAAACQQRVEARRGAGRCGGHALQASTPSHCCRSRRCAIPERQRRRRDERTGALEVRLERAAQVAVLQVRAAAAHARKLRLHVVVAVRAAALVDGGVAHAAVLPRAPRPVAPGAWRRVTGLL